MSEVPQVLRHLTLVASNFGLVLPRNTLVSKESTRERYLLSYKLSSYM